MKIFQLNTFCGVKSTGRIACEIAKLVKQNGGECKIGYGVPEISDESAPFAVQVGGRFERKLHGALRKLFDAEGYGSFFGTLRLISCLKQYQPDLIHLHNLHGCYLHLGLLFRYLKKMKCPIVWTLHDCWPFTGHCAYFDFSGCGKWKTQCHSCPQQHRYPVCIGLDGSARNHRAKKRWFSLPESITFVAPCEWMKSPLNASFLKNNPVRVIPNGVNLSVFHPTESRLREKYKLQNVSVCLAAASEWDERKGLRYLLEASEKLGDSFRFVVIGLSAEQIAGLPEGMIGLEHTANSSELAAWYTLADCFVNPTLEDNMPMVNLEALACGTPVAVFRTGGCPEAIHEHCGAVVEQGKTDELCDKIRFLCQNKSEMHTECLRQARKFDAELTFQAYLELYKEILS